MIELNNLNNKTNSELLEILNNIYMDLGHHNDNYLAFECTMRTLQVLRERDVECEELETKLINGLRNLITTGFVLGVVLNDGNFGENIKNKN